MLRRFALLCAATEAWRAPPRLHLRRSRLAVQAAAGGDALVRTLLLDNYDSYTYNLFQLLARVNGIEPLVVPNDAMPLGTTWDAFVQSLGQPFDNVVLSPGPGRPEVPADFGLCAEALRSYDGPLLGVCLGHQGLGHAHGARVVHAPEVMHGRWSRVFHDGRGLFQGVPPGAEAVRYHSLVVEPESLRALGTVDKEGPLRPTAWSQDGVIMGLEHATLPHYGVQFHPESVGTEFGHRLLQNFRDLTLEHDSKVRGTHRTGAAPLVRRGSSVSADTLSTPPSDHQGRPRPPVAAREERRFDVVASQVARRVPHGAVEDIFAALYGDAPTSFWLDSSNVDQGNAGDGNPHGARWSYLGAADGPEAFTYSYRGPGTGRITSPVNGTVQAEDVFPFMASSIAHASVASVHVLDTDDAEIVPERAPECASDRLRDTLRGNAVPFIGGLVGYIGYEARHDVEILRSSSTPHARAEAYLEDPHVPDAFFLFSDRVLAYDHELEQLTVLQLVPAGSAAARRDAETWCAGTASDVAGVLAAADPSTHHGSVADLPGLGTLEGLAFRPAAAREAYMEKIDRCHRHIHEGESYEICLTTQLAADLNAAATPEPRQQLSFYRRLRRKNPAPYGAYLFHDPSGLLRDQSSSAPPAPGPAESTDAFAICCSSPERFLRARDGVVESKPIKGTVRRNKVDAAEDARLAGELEASIKNRAENLMIVDLVRNDLGRVCEVGSVNVSRLMAVETYETVHQLVSTVEGRLRRDVSIVDAVKACYPGGSMTGAPKVRTLDIIHDLEDGIPRGVYSGTLGFISASGSADLNIVIRTAVITPCGVRLGAGGAVTALSDRADEFEEMLLKAESVANAVGASIRRNDAPAPALPPVLHPRLDALWPFENATSTAAMRMR